MTDTVQKAFSKVQWHGMVKRASFGANSGLNSNSPISETPYLKQEWARIGTPEMLVFRRTTPYKVTAKTNDICYVFKKSYGHPYTEGNWQEEIAITSGEPGPAIGEECFFAFEIRKPDAQGVPRPHDLPFEALGEIGCWKDHDLARGFAFRVEWGTAGRIIHDSSHSESLEQVRCQEGLLRS